MRGYRSEPGAGAQTRDSRGAQLPVAWWPANCSVSLQAGAVSPSNPGGRRKEVLSSQQVDPKSRPPSVTPVKEERDAQYGREARACHVLVTWGTRCCHTQSPLSAQLGQEGEQACRSGGGQDLSRHLAAQGRMGVQGQETWLDLPQSSTCLCFMVSSRRTDKTSLKPQ